MSSLSCTIRLETPADAAAIDALHDISFGPGRFARSAFRVREGVPHDPGLSFVALHEGDVAGSVRLTPVHAGGTDMQLLGPLAVLPQFKNRGMGRKLMQVALDAARAAGESLVLLVGDAPYYGPFGFRPVPMGQLIFPGPVDPARILLAELEDGAAARATGRVTGGRCMARGLSGPRDTMSG